MKNTYNLINIIFSNKLIVIIFLIGISTLQLSAQNNLTDSDSKKKKAAPKVVKALDLNDFIKNQSNKKPSNVTVTNINLQEFDHIVTSEHISSISGIHHKYLRQVINGIEVYGTESSIHTAPNNEVVATHNLFISDIQATIITGNTIISSEVAVTSLANQMQYSMTNLVRIEDKGGVNKQVIYNNAGISKSAIPAKLMYLSLIHI